MFNSAMDRACEALIAAFFLLIKEDRSFVDRTEWVFQGKLAGRASKLLTLGVQKMYHQAEQQRKEGRLLWWLLSFMEDLMRCVSADAACCTFFHSVEAKRLPAILLAVVTHVVMGERVEGGDCSVGIEVLQLTVRLMLSGDERQCQASRQTLLNLFAACLEPMAMFSTAVCHGDPDKLRQPAYLRACLGKLASLMQPLRHILLLSRPMFGRGDMGLLANALKLAVHCEALQEMLEEVDEGLASAGKSGSSGGGGGVGSSSISSSSGVGEQRRSSVVEGRLRGELHAALVKQQEMADEVCCRCVEPDHIKANITRLELTWKAWSAVGLGRITPHEHFLLLEYRPPGVSPEAWRLTTVHQLMRQYRRLSYKSYSQLVAGDRGRRESMACMLASCSSLATLATVDSQTAQIALDNDAVCAAMRLVGTAFHELATLVPEAESTVMVTDTKQCCQVVQMLRQLPACIKESVLLLCALLDVSSGATAPPRTRHSPKLRQATVESLGRGNNNLREVLEGCIKDIRAESASPVERSLGSAARLEAEMVAHLHRMTSPLIPCLTHAMLLANFSVHKDNRADATEALSATKPLMLGLLQLHGRVTVALSSSSENHKLVSSKRDHTGEDGSSSLMHRFLRTVHDFQWVPVSSCELELMQQAVADVVTAMLYGGPRACELHMQVGAALDSLAAATATAGAAPAGAAPAPVVMAALVKAATAGPGASVSTATGATSASRGVTAVASPSSAVASPAPAPAATAVAAAGGTGTSGRAAAEETRLSQLMAAAVAPLKAVIGAKTAAAGVSPAAPSTRGDRHSHSSTHGVGVSGVSEEVGHEIDVSELARGEHLHASHGGGGGGGVVAEGSHDPVGCVLANQSVSGTCHWSSSEDAFSSNGRASCGSSTRPRSNVATPCDHPCSNSSSSSGGGGGAAAAAAAAAAGDTTAAAAGEPSSPPRAAPVPLDVLLSRLSLHAWRNPDALVAAVRHHCELCPSPSPVSSVVGSDASVGQSPPPHTGEPPPPPPSVWVRAKTGLQAERQARRSSPASTTDSSGRSSGRGGGGLVGACVLAANNGRDGLISGNPGMSSAMRFESDASRSGSPAAGRGGSDGASGSAMRDVVESLVHSLTETLERFCNTAQALKRNGAMAPVGQTLLLCVHGLHCVLRHEGAAVGQMLCRMRFGNVAPLGAPKRHGNSSDVAHAVVAVLMFAQLLHATPPPSFNGANGATAGGTRHSSARTDKGATAGGTLPDGSITHGRLAMRLTQATQAFQQDLLLVVPELRKTFDDALCRLAAVFDRQRR